MSDQDRPKSAHMESNGPPLTRRKFIGRGAQFGSMAVMMGMLDACGSQSGTSLSGGGAGGSLTIAVFEVIDTLDPGATGLVSTYQVLANVFDPLVWYLPQYGGTGHFPGLAESYKVSADAKTYTFKLRKGVRFHDGTPFTAADVKATFDHIVDPSTHSKSAIGALGPYKETRIIDDYEVEVVFSAPNAAFLNEMSSPPLAISSAAALRKYGTAYGEHPVGTGPFALQKWTQGQVVALKRNPDYEWGPRVGSLSGGPARLKSLAFRTLSDPNTQYSALLSGEIQVAQDLTPQNVVSLTGSGGKYKKITATVSGMPYDYMLNAQKAPTDELAVRQAIQYATNQADIVRTLYDGVYEPADSCLTPSTMGYNKSQALYDYNPAKAKALLDGAGWVMGPGGVRQKNGRKLALVDIDTTNFGFQNVSTILQNQLSAVGFTMSISEQAHPQVNATYNAGAQNLADWVYYDVDPFLLYTVFGCQFIKSGFNWEHYCDPQLTKLIETANGEPAPAARTKLYEQAAYRIMEAAVILPIYNPVGLFVMPKNVSGLVFTPDALPLCHGATLGS